MSDFHLAFQESGSLPYFCISANASSLQFAVPVLGPSHDSAHSGDAVNTDALSW